MTFREDVVERYDVPCRTNHRAAEEWREEDIDTMLLEQHRQLDLAPCPAVACDMYLELGGRLECVCGTSMYDGEGLAISAMADERLRGRARESADACRPRRHRSEIKTYFQARTSSGSGEVSTPKPACQAPDGITKPGSDTIVCCCGGVLWWVVFLD
jgi:hypothetical protein